MFRLLDFTTPLEEYREHVATLQCAALWFLGDCVDFFADSSADCAALLQALLLRLQKAAVMGDWKVGVCSLNEG